MDPLLYDTLEPKILPLSTPAARTRLGEGIRSTTMKNRILRVAREVDVAVTIRRVSGGLLAAGRCSCIQPWRPAADPRGGGRAPASRTTMSIGTALRGEFGARHPAMLTLLALQPQ